MAQTLITLSNGERLAVGVYTAFLQLQAAVRAALGIILVVNSGFRTAEVQEAIFRARYVTAGNINGRRVYDIRYWNGVAWYRISSEGTVAVPRTSRHEQASAVDFGGIPAGGGNTLANWMRANGPRFGFSPTGYGFGEAWHYDFTGDPWAGNTPAGTPSAPSPQPVQEDDMSMTTIRHPNGTIFFADELGSDHAGDYKTPDIDLGEFLGSLSRVWGPTEQVTAREFDIANAIALRRWQRKRAEIVDGVVAQLRPVIENARQVILDPALIRDAIKEAVNGTGVDTTLDDATIDKLANRVLDLQHARLAE